MYYRWWTRRCSTWSQYANKDRLFLQHEYLKQAVDAFIDKVPIHNIRNFSVIAHIDHGKSTLADRLLERCGNITAKQRKEAQILDTLQVERERGITVKAQSASMLVRDNGLKDIYLLNLIDTPGHVDFSFEVSRSLTACEGALLLVDSAQGVQAQTIATYRAAVQQGLTIVPVLTKIDMPHAQAEDRALELAMLLDVDPESIIMTSAKANIGIDQVLQAVVERIPPPKVENSDSVEFSLVDSVYDSYRGIICQIKVKTGYVKVGAKVSSMVTNQEYDIQELGVLLPRKYPTKVLGPGQVGYIVPGMKSLLEAKIGDCFYTTGAPKPKAVAFQEAKCMVFASIYPTDDCAFDDLRNAVHKLLLTDASVSATPETSTALGMGFRCGFLGLLHMEVFHQRLSDEQNMQVLVTAPMVPYTIVYPDGRKIKVETPEEFPVVGREVQVLEPMVEASIISPSEYMGELLTLLQQKRGTQTNLEYLDDTRISLTYAMPWQEIVTDFYDELKSITSGYATLHYTELEPQQSDIVKVDLLINSKSLDALSFVCHRSKSVNMGRALCKKLSKVIDRQQYEITIQAAVGTKVFAKARIAPYRKDVLMKSGKAVGGGDITRKQKLLAKQKEGKKRMKTVANVPLSQDAFWSVMKK